MQIQSLPGKPPRTTHIKNEERILRRHDLDGAVWRYLGSFLMPPLVSSFGPLDRFSGALEHENMLYLGALLESGIDNRLGRNGLSTTFAFVGRNNHARVAIHNSFTERLGAKACKDDRVDGANACAREEGRDGLPGHWKVDRHCITLADTKRLENIGDAADFAEEFTIGDGDTLVWLVSLPDDSNLR